MKKSFIKTTSLIAVSALAIACIPISNGINVFAATLLSAEFETTNALPENLTHQHRLNKLLIRS